MKARADSFTMRGDREETADSLRLQRELTDEAQMQGKRGRR